MSEPFLGEIKIFGFNFAPRGWATCDGQLLPINQNQALFSLLGTMYGGDGRTTFGLPELRGRSPMHRGDGFTQGQKSGAETVPLVAAEMPQHTHLYRASEDSDAPVPTGALLGGPVLSGGAPATPLLRSGEPGPDFKVAPADEEAETGPDVVLQWQALTGELYADTSAGTLTALQSDAVTTVGVGAGHQNMMPYLTLNFCIALVGLFPSRN